MSKKENSDPQKPLSPIEALLQGDLKAIDVIYIEIKPKFLAWGKKQFNLDESDLLDCWQDAVIALYEQVRSGKFTSLDVSLETYLFAIGKNKILNKIRKHNRSLSIDRVEDSLGLKPIEEENTNENQNLIEVQTAMSALSNGNRSILLQRYFDGLSLEEIQKQGQYASLNTVSATLSRAMAQLKTLLKRKQ